MPAVPGIVAPSASAIIAIVDAVPIVLQCPRLRIIDDSDLRKSSSDSVPARTSSLSRQTSVPQPSGMPRKVPVSIGPPGTTTRGEVDRRGCHQQRRDRLVAAAEQHHTVDRVGPEHLLGGHRGHVAPEHRGRSDQRLAEGDHRQVERDPAGLVDTLLDALRDLVEVRVAGRQVGGGVGDRDVRPPVEGVRGQPPAHPGPVDVGVAVGPGVPLAAAWRAQFPFSKPWSSVRNRDRDYNDARQPGRDGLLEPGPGALLLAGRRAGTPRAPRAPPRAVCSWPGPAAPGCPPMPGPDSSTLRRHREAHAPRPRRRRTSRRPPRRRDVRRRL